MGLPEAMISSIGNFVSAMADLLGTISGGVVFKPTAVQRALGQHTTMEPNRIDTTDTNNNPGSSGQDIYKNPDIYLTVPELIEKSGYPFESHDVVTKDKYIITVFRIPHGKTNKMNISRPPVLLVHGLLNSAGAWIMHQEDKALAYMLANNSYDSWLINCRGCTYSRKHQELSVDDKEYWDFSFVEMGIDVAEVIDYILKTTGYESLYYIGHSLGSTMLMIAINEDERLINKIKLFIALAPAVYLYKTTAKLLSINAPFYNQQKALLDFVTKNGELMDKTFLQQLKPYIPPLFCPEYVAAKCVQASMYTMGGYNPDQIYWPQLPVLAAHSPSSTSVRTYIHCLQYLSKPFFRQYDYGSPEENMKKYGQPQPKSYDVKKVTTPIVIFYGENDLLCRPEAVMELANELPNVVGCHRVPCDKFAHTDFLYAKDVDSLVYNSVIHILDKSCKRDESSETSV